MRGAGNKMYNQYQQVSMQNLEMLAGLLGMLRALKWNYWNSHWMVSGDPYYADHLLFERLYNEVIDDQIDTLAEKITAYNRSILSENVMRNAFNGFLDKHSAKNPFERGLSMENHFQSATKSVYNSLKAANELSLGMDDFLMATASERETVIYLLKQRIR